MILVLVSQPNINYGVFCTRKDINASYLMEDCNTCSMERHGTGCRSMQQNRRVNSEAKVGQVCHPSHNNWLTSRKMTS